MTQILLRLPLYIGIPVYVKVTLYIGVALYVHTVYIYIGERTYRDTGIYQKYPYLYIHMYLSLSLSAGPFRGH